MELVTENLRKKCDELGVLLVPGRPRRRQTAEEVVKKFIAEQDELDSKRDPGHIPKFHPRLTLEVEQEAFKTRMREDAREYLLRSKSNDLLDHDELTVLHDTLKKHATPPHTGQELFINYLDFKEMVSKLCSKGKKMLNAKTFLKLMGDDPYGRVSVTTLFNYAMRKTWFRQTRIGLSLYDDNGKGFIELDGLQNYITELIPTLVQLSGMEDTHVPFYICNATRKFIFFLDPNRTGRIRIVDILSCGFIDEILELRNNETPKLSNWFSVQTAMRLYDQFVNLDKDHSGLLRKEELLHYGSGNNMILTETFIDRVFQECLTFEGEMDYKSYLDFVLAMENRNEPQAIQYFFRILDINHQGYLDAFTLNYFFRDIINMLEQNGGDRISFDDIKDEVFDMVKPKDPYKITLEDLIICGAGATVIHILTDFRGFWTYETRESLIPDIKNSDNARKSTSQVEFIPSG